MYQCIREGRYPMPSHLSPSARELIGKLLAPDPAARPSLEEALNHAFFSQVRGKMIVAMSVCQTRHGEL